MDKHQQVLMEEDEFIQALLVVVCPVQKKKFRADGLVKDQDQCMVAPQVSLEFMAAEFRLVRLLRAETNMFLERPFTLEELLVEGHLIQQQPDHMLYLEDRLAFRVRINNTQYVQGINQDKEWTKVKYSLVMEDIILTVHLLMVLVDMKASFMGNCRARMDQTLEVTMVDFQECSRGNMRALMDIIMEMDRVDNISVMGMVEYMLLGVQYLMKSLERKMGEYMKDLD